MLTEEQAAPTTQTRKTVGAARLLRARTLFFFSRWFLLLVVLNQFREPIGSGSGIPRVLVAEVLADAT